jgi:hypothetical protein
MRVELSESERLSIRDNGSISLGRHSIGFEGELIRAEFFGTISLDQVLRMLSYYEEALRLGRRLFVLALSREDGELMSAEMRRTLADWTRTHEVKCLAVVGGGNWISVSIVSLLLRAISLVARQPIPLRFFPNEHDARRWIDDLRG